MRRKLGFAVAVVFGLAGLVRAEPLDLKQISAEAKWAAHLDVDALHASALREKVRQRVQEKHPEIEKCFAMICDVWKFDPRTDLHGITIYGTQLKPNTGVAIVHAKVDQKLLLEKAKAAPNHKASTHGQYELQSWLHAAGSKRERAMTGTFYKPDVLVFGASADEVKAALDVLDGTKPNFTAKESNLTLSIPPGAVLVAGVAGLVDADLPCKSPLAKQTDALALAVGENQGEIFFVGQLAVKKPEIAQQIKTVADGGLALAAMLHSDDAEALKMIGAVKVNVADKAVALEWRAPVEAAWAQMQKCIAKAKAAHKGWWNCGKPERCPLEK